MTKPASAWAREKAREFGIAFRDNGYFAGPDNENPLVRGEAHEQLAHTLDEAREQGREEVQREWDDAAEADSYRDDSDSYDRGRP